MDFRILGPLEVVEADRLIELGGRKQRIVLVHLLLNAGRTTPTARLIDDVWGDDPPEAARNSLQSYVSHLRKALGASRIRSVGGGYVLLAESDEIDSRRFEASIDRAQEQALTAPETAAATLRFALATWRGSALSDMADELSLVGEIARLEEVKLRATEHLYAAEIAAGRHSAVIGDLVALTSRHQMRERLCAHLMLALYRCGRQGEALAAYARMRAVLKTEIGIDPSPELEDLYLQVLRQVPELDASSRFVATPRRAFGLSPGSHFGEYRIERLLGQGGMGVVYLAEHLGLGRQVAVKVLAKSLADDPAFVDRFVRESRIAASIDHPNVIPIYEAGHEGGEPFIAMRFVEGNDLRRTLDEQGPLDIPRAINILRQVADALDAAHASGLVHRDIKPANVLLTAPQTGSDEHVYLVDFGLAARLNRDDASPEPAALVGTVDYVPPEGFLGEPLDGRADVYALACVLFECLTGSSPYRRADVTSVIRAHLDDPIPRATAVRPELPAALDSVFRRALAKSPIDRYESCGTFARAVASAMSMAQPSPMPSGAVSPTRRRRIIAAAVGIAATIAAATLAVTVGDRRDHAVASLIELPPGIAIIDASSGHEVAFIASSVVRQPVEAIYAAGSFWVLNLEPMSFVEVDAQSGAVVRQIASPLNDVGSYTVDGNSLWISDYSQPVVSKVDIALGREVLRFDDLPGRGGSYGVAVADDSLWVARRDAYGGLGALLRLDPATGAVQHQFRSLRGSYAVANGGDGAVWTAGTWGAVNRVDPQTNTVTSTDVGGRNFYLAVGAGYGWTTDEAEGVVHQVDASGAVAATIPTGAGARSVSFSDGKVWVGNQDAGTVSAVDASDRTTTSYVFGHRLNTIAAGDGRVLVELAVGAPNEDPTAMVKGDVARLLVGSYELDALDSVLPVSDLGQEALDATCARLVRRTNSNSADNNTVEPDVAASMPTVSGDGRTYTFTVRSGFRFSPPSGEIVSAETFRATIERALSPLLPATSPGPVALSDVEGLAAFRNGRTTHVSGVDASGDHVSITLTAPSSNLLQRLASLAFCAVPIATPIDSFEGGVAIPVAGEASEVMVASAGPYYIAQHVNGEYTILKVNPNYAGDRSHRFDAIVLREGIAPSQARALVDANKWDGITNMPEVADDIGSRIGCQTLLPGGTGIDLAALCPVS